MKGEDGEPCIGWPANPPCPEYGLMHGCQLPDGHLNQWHICPCGEVIRTGKNPGPLNVCGTNAGYMRHQRNGDIACIPCRAAHSRYEQGRKMTRRAG